jgi:aryl-alcohol dehydrogenase-like predicted oxidoreductase
MKGAVMQYRYMGKSGLRVSDLCLGAMTFGRETTEPDSFTILDTFIEAGGNFIDTANVYSQGLSEQILGRWLKAKAGQRDSLVIATKTRFPMGPGPNQQGLSRKQILASVEDSLRRLQTDYIDLYQVHAWDDATPLEETLSTLDSLVKSGKVRYLGASNFAGWQLQKAIDLANFKGWEAFSCLQPLYNLLDRYLELDLLPVCLNEGVGIITWSPLRGGWLSGKYRRGMQTPPSNTRIEAASTNNWNEKWENYANERTWKIIDQLLAVSEQLQKSPAQVALNWVLSQPGITSAIIGARNLEQLKDNLGASGWELNREQLDELNQVSELPLSYPHDTLQRFARRH